MPYQFRILYQGKEQPMHNLDIAEFPVLTRAFEVLDKTLSEDFDITVARVGSTHPPFDRKKFKEIIRESEGEQLLVLAHFCHEDEFEAFVAKRQVHPANTLSAYPDYELIQGHPNASEVIIYPQGYYIIKVTEPTDQPGVSRDSYLFQPPADVSIEQRDELRDMEDVVYMCYLADALP
jgi:hypothetical protein